MGWRWRLAGVGLLAAALAGGALLVVPPLVIDGLVQLLGLGLRASVWLASALASGADAWTILGTVGRTMSRVLISTQALAILAILVLVGAVALYGLQRLLGFEEGESLR